MTDYTSTPCFSSSAYSGSCSWSSRGGKSPRFGLLLALSAAGTLLGAGCMERIGGQDDAQKQKGVGAKFVGWQLQPLTGDSHSLSAEQAQGHVVLMNFWGTWCPPCRAEFPHIAELARRHSDNPDLIVAAVSCGASGNDSDLEPLREETAAFLEKAKSDLPTYADQDAVTRQKLMNVIDFDGYPATVVLDREGVVRGVWIGYEPGTEKQMERLVEQLLRQGAPAGK